MRLSLILALFLLPGLLQAVDSNLDPALASSAASYRGQIGKLRDIRVNTLIAAQDRYIAELKAADEKATKEGDLTVVALVTKERKAMEDGVLTGEPSADLPRKLVPGRKACLKECAKAIEEHSKAVNKLNADYLAALGRIQSTAPSGNTALLEQIAEEKKSVLAGNIGPVTDLHLQLANTRWNSVGNPGEIRTFSATQMNDRWNYTVVDNNTVTVHWNETSGVTFVLDKDGRTFLLNGKPDMILVADGAKK